MKMTLEAMRERIGYVATRIEELRKQEGLSEKEEQEMDALLVEGKQLRSKIEREMSAENLNEFVSAEEPVVETREAAPRLEVRNVADAAKYSLGEFLRDLAGSVRYGRITPRLEMQQKRAKSEYRAATGASEGLPADGGFLVGTDMVGDILKKVYNNSDLLSRVSRRTISNGSNSMTINGIDESSRVNGSRHGGVQSYWVGEGSDLTASRPKFRRIELRLKKLAVLAYATDELVSDASMLEQEISAAVQDELNFKLQDGIINGTGSGQMLGILNSPAAVQVAEETSQTDDTIVYANIVKMYSRFWGNDGIWIANRDTFPQLAQMSLEVGDGGSAVYLPANGAAGRPYNTLMGMPLFFIEQCPTLGDVGDIMLIDPSQYILADKGGIQTAMSIHVQFVNDEIVYRWTMRVDGQPSWNSALTPYKGSATRSPFVTLATH
jgi:HK97 family phage major capsid protein